jgi:hypothetical protein
MGAAWRILCKGASRCLERGCDGFAPFRCASKETMSKSEKEYNTVSLTLGIIGTIIGVLALLGAWIPALGLATVPYSIIGICLSGVGIGYALLKNCRAIELPILGVLICITAITISITSTYLAAAAAAKAVQIAAEQARKHHADEVAAQLQREQQYRQKQISECQTEIPRLEMQCAEADEALELAKTNLDFENSDYQSFITNRPYLTNEVYVSICRELTSTYPVKTRWQIESLQVKLRQIVDRADQFHLKKIYSARGVYQEDRAQFQNLQEELDAEKSSLEKLQNSN